MIVYLDMAFLLNCMTDALALYVTAQLSGLPVRAKRLLAASLAGGTYGMLCALPGLHCAASFFPQFAAAAGLVWLAFGRREAFLRQFLLFFMLSCTMGGTLVAAGRLLESGGGRELLAALDWRVFLLAGGCCFLVLSVVFRGGARHQLAGQLCRCTVEWRGASAQLAALLDTGHTLTDSLTGRPVLTVHCAALEPLWPARERGILSRLERDGAAACLERLGAGSGFWLLPYQAVGVSGGLLLCFRADRVALDGREWKGLTVALSPTAVSDGGGYSALWGGETGKEVGGHAA